MRLSMAENPRVLLLGAPVGTFGSNGILVTAKGEMLPNRLLFSKHGNMSTDGQEKPVLVMCFWFFLEKALKRSVPSNLPGEQGGIKYCLQLY